MRNVIWILWITLVLGLFLLVGTVAAEVVWTDEVSDPAGDVEDADDNPVDYPGADILSVSIADEGDSINVTMVLAGEYNSSGSYSVSVKVDGTSDAYDFSRMSFMGFMATDPDGNLVSVDGYISDDGTIISWVVAKADIDATEKLEISMGMVMVMDLFGDAPTVFDYAGFGGGPSGDFNPSKVTYVIEFTKLHVMRMTATMLFEGLGAADLRDWVDADDDGTITAAEVQEFEDMMSDDDTEVEINMTLDGKESTSVVGEIRLEGAEGSTQPTVPTTIVAIQTVTFPKPSDADTHTYAWPEDDDDGFPGGEGDWDDATDITFKITGPDGWKFKTKDWPAGLKDYVEKDGTEIVMKGSDYKNDFNSTLGQMNEIVVEKTDESPGFGLVAALAATFLAALVVRSRR